MGPIDPRLTGERRTGADRKLTPEKELEVVQDYLRGMKLKLFKEKFGITRWTVHVIVRRHGYEPTRRKKEPRTSSQVTGP